MSRDEIKSRIPILQAWLEQKPIENSFMMTCGEWSEWKLFGADPNWSEHPNIFDEKQRWRIKPEAPKPREWWLVPVLCPDDPLIHWVRYNDEQSAKARIAQWSNPWQEILHVREVLSCEPEPIVRTGEAVSCSLETAYNAAAHAYGRSRLRKDLAAPPDQ